MVKSSINIRTEVTKATVLRHTIIITQHPPYLSMCKQSM